MSPRTPWPPGSAPPAGGAFVPFPAFRAKRPPSPSPSASSSLVDAELWRSSGSRASAVRRIRLRRMADLSVPKAPARSLRFRYRKRFLQGAGDGEACDGVEGFGGVAEQQPVDLRPPPVEVRVVLPGEPDAAVHLDERLGGPLERLGGVRLRRGGGQRQLLRRRVGRPR